MQDKYLRDEVVNLVLSRERHKRYVSSIIGAILKMDVDDVYDNLIYISNRVNDNINYKYSYVDNVYNLKEKVVNIEINYIKSTESINKNMRYICNLLLKQVRPGDKDIYNGVIQININNYDFFGKEKFIYKSGIYEENLNLTRSDLIKIYDINMDYLKKLSYNKVKKMSSESLERLLYVFVCDDDERESMYRGEEMMEDLVDDLYHINEDGLLAYDIDEFHRREAKEVGMREGREEGLKEGRKEIISRMLTAGIKIEELSKVLEISVDEIESIIKE